MIHAPYRALPRWIRSVLILPLAAPSLAPPPASVRPTTGVIPAWVAVRQPGRRRGASSTVAAAPAASATLRRAMDVGVGAPRPTAAVRGAECTRRGDRRRGAGPGCVDGGHRLYRVIEVDGRNGVARMLIEESSPTFVEDSELSGDHRNGGKHRRRGLRDRAQIPCASERDGWEHLNLYDAKAGRVLRQVTHGEWVVRKVDRVDEAGVDNAWRLQGHLLLVTGDLDMNVDPASIVQVADRLIKAGKDFDLLIVPGGDHGQRRLLDFFLRWLKHVPTPDWNALPASQRHDRDDPGRRSGIEADWPGAADWA